MLQPFQPLLGSILVTGNPTPDSPLRPLTGRHTFLQCWIFRDSHGTLGSRTLIIDFEGGVQEWCWVSSSISFYFVFWDRTSHWTWRLLLSSWDLTVSTPQPWNYGCVLSPWTLGSKLGSYHRATLSHCIASHCFQPHSSWAGKCQKAYTHALAN